MLASPAPPSSSLPPGVSLDTRTSEDREGLLNTLADVYFQKDGDCLDFELACLPLAVTATELEAAAEDRTVALEAVSEKLSHHILRNYDAFAAGVDEVIGTVELLEAAALKSKISREGLSVAAAEVQRGIGVWRNTQRKRGLTELLDILLRLRRAREIAGQLSTTLSEGDFCSGLWLSEQLAEAAESLGPDLELANELQIKACAGIEDSYSQIKVTVAALTSDFQPQAFDKVLQGYALLASSSNFSIEIDPGGDVRAAFSAAPGAAAQKVLRGVLLARAGLEEKAAEADTLPALVALLPSDLFRTCLARVMMVFWDLLAAHYAMLRCHATDNLGGSENGTAIPSGHHSREEEASNEKLDTPAPPLNNNGTARSEPDNDDDATFALKEQIDFVYASISSGLSSSRRVLWDECSRALGTLISAPAAVEGEHFMHVVAWTQRLIEAGESFSAGEATALRAVLHRQAGTYLKSYHESNIEALNSMLNKEMWKRLPITELPPLFNHQKVVDFSRHDPDVPSFSSSPSNLSSTLPEFSTLVMKGNPWYTTRSFLGNSQSDTTTTTLEIGGGSGIGKEDDNGLFSETNYDIPLTSLSTPTNTATTTSSSPPLAPPQQQQHHHHHLEEITVTNSSWRMAKWLRDYVGLMNTLPESSNSIFNGMMELLDLYLLHVYLDFGEGALLLGGGGGGGGGGISLSSSNYTASNGSTSIHNLTEGTSEYLTPRLRTTLQHIALGSMSKHRAVLAAGGKVGSKLARALAPNLQENARTASSSSASGPVSSAPHPALSPGSSTEMKTMGATSSGPQHHVKPGTAHHHRAASASPSATAATASSAPSSIAHSGNLYGLLERHTAGESLICISRHLSNPKTTSYLESFLPKDDKITVSMYCGRILGASQDLYDSIMVHGCRLMLPLYWVPEAVGAAGGSEYQAAEPPAEAAPWAKQLTRQLELFGAQLNQAEGMMMSTVPTMAASSQNSSPERASSTTTTRATSPTSPSETVVSNELWQHATRLLADALLDGFSRVKKCTLEGRSAMSADLQAVRHALPRGYWDVLRKADDYIKAFYVPLPELAAWAELHPGYSDNQVLALAQCIGESSGLKKKDLQAAMMQVEAGLVAVSQNKIKGGSEGAGKAPVS
ncbi:hypothetical protein Ndes2526A_g00871 [Nannochloris sp. 'desiccata']